MLSRLETRPEWNVHNELIINIAQCATFFHVGHIILVQKSNWKRFQQGKLFQFERLETLYILLRFHSLYLKLREAAEILQYILK